MSIKNSNRYHYHFNKIKLSGVDYSINKGFYIIKLPKSYVCSWYKTTEWNSNFSEWLLFNANSANFSAISWREHVI